jgi:hypothetical protein
VLVFNDHRAAPVRRQKTRCEIDISLVYRRLRGGAKCERAAGTARAVEITERNHMLNVN